MSRGVWLERIGPALIVIGGALLLTAAISFAGPTPRRAAAAEACAESAPAAASRTVARASRSGGAAVRVHEALGIGGELTGRRLSASLGDGSSVDVDLPPESFVAERNGAAVVFGYHAAGRSEVRLLDVDNGCTALLAASTDVTRSAVLDPTGAHLYVHSVTAHGRADSGVARHELATGAVALVVPPLHDDQRFGRTFATRLAWSADETELVVHSCGFAACRTRVLDTSTGVIQAFDSPGRGELVGVTGAYLLAFADCLGRPCDVLSVDRETGAEKVLAEEAWSADVRAEGNGRPTVAIQTSAGQLEVAL